MRAQVLASAASAALQEAQHMLVPVGAVFTVPGGLRPLGEAGVLAASIRHVQTLPCTSASPFGQE